MVFVDSVFGFFVVFVDSVFGFFGHGGVAVGITYSRNDDEHNFLIVIILNEIDHPKSKNTILIDLNGQRVTLDY